jgi:hypothetical protein
VRGPKRKPYEPDAPARIKYFRAKRYIQVGVKRSPGIVFMAQLPDRLLVQDGEIFRSHWRNNDN